MTNKPHLTVSLDAPFGATWLINAPWAHPAWSQYALLLYDLTTPIAPEPIVYLDGATHEMLLFALDPDRPQTTAQEMMEGRRFHALEPPNYGYQFKADSSEAAVARLQEVVDAIEAQHLSPDTDFRATWDLLFHDAHSLRRAA